MANTLSLYPGIKWRLGVRPDGVTKRVYRTSNINVPPAQPKTRSQFGAFMFVCPITKTYVVAARGDVHNGYVCYQTFTKRAAALMYAIMGDAQ